MTAILEFCYFLLIKLFCGVILLFDFLIIPAVIAGIIAAIWPYDDKWLRPSVTQRRWMVVVAVIGLIAYGSQMNWVFNMPPSPTFKTTVDNFFESFEQHKRAIENAKPPTRINVGTEIRRFELTGMNPPKHFYVSLEEVNTHRVFKQVYVTKHCNSYAKNKIGNEYNILVHMYRMSNDPGTIYYDFQNLQEVFCNGE